MKESENKESEFVDPVSVTRLSRRNILALALSLAGVLLVLFFSSRRQSAEPVSEYELPPSSTMDVLTLTPVQPRTSISTPWESNTSLRPERTDERKSIYDQARQSRGVLHISSTVNPQDATPNLSIITEEEGLILLEGSVITAALETGIHTGRPGPVRARVVRPVRDSRQLEKVLIPPGTQLIGTMEGTLAEEEPRALLIWNRMVFPNGKTRDLPGLPALEQSGEGGLQDKVKRHRIQRFGSAAMLALVGSATSIATATTTGSLVGGSLALELSRTASSQLDVGKRRRPTLILRPGYQFLVYVSRDMRFSGPYVD